MRPQLLFRAHLGLGDHLVCNALCRYFARTHQVFVPCKRHNAPTLAFMFRDNKQIEHLVVQDDAEADEFMKVVRGHGHSVIGLGAYGPSPFNPKVWDQEMYRQAGVPFPERWNRFTVHRQPSRELKPPDGPFAFVHEDGKRGFLIDRTLISKNLPVVYADPNKTINLFDWWGHIETATELHLIDSCFAIMADSLPELRAKRKLIHIYARPGALPPSYTKDWEILR